MTHLQDKLPALEFTGVPVGQFVAFLSEFSTVPMVIDAQSLVEAGKSAKTRISVKLDDATVEEALEGRVGQARPGVPHRTGPPGHHPPRGEIEVVLAASSLAAAARRPWPPGRPFCARALAIEFFHRVG